MLFKMFETEKHFDSRKHISLILNGYYFQTYYIIFTEHINLHDLYNILQIFGISSQAWQNFHSSIYVLQIIFFFNNILRLLILGKFNFLDLLHYSYAGLHVHVFTTGVCWTNKIYNTIVNIEKINDYCYSRIKNTWKTNSHTTRHTHSIDLIQIYV